MKIYLAIVLLLVYGYLFPAVLLGQTTGYVGEVVSEVNDGAIQWSFGLSAGPSFGLKSDEGYLFRGNGLNTKMFGRYYFGKLGLSASAGFITGGVDQSRLNDFIIQRGFPLEELTFTKGNHLNGFILFGPSFRFGKKLFVNAAIEGGLFLNGAANIDVAYKDRNTAIYSAGGSGKNSAFGFSGSLSVNYSLNKSTQISLHSDYFQTSSSINLIDMKGGHTSPARVNRDVRLMTAGIGITKSFGKPAGSQVGKARINGSKAGNCGPVSLSVTRQDGSIEKYTFSCPEDAIKYRQMVKDSSKEKGNPIDDDNATVMNPLYNSSGNGDPVAGSALGRIAITIDSQGTISGKMVDGRVASGISFLNVLDDGTLQGKLNAQDFNTCRSNRERGQFRTDPIDGGGSVVGDIVIFVASDGKISGSIGSGDLSGKSFVKILDDGTLQGKLNAQDFNTCRSNRERGQFRTDPIDGGGSVFGDIVISVASDGKISGSIASGDLSGKSFVKILDDGTLQGKLNAQDFNTCRSNKERGQFRTDPIDGGGNVVGDIVISVASDGKISGSIGSGDLSGKSFVKILDDGTLQGKLNAQDFNTCRSNRERGQFRTDPIDGGGSVVGDIVISVASDGKVSGSIASGDLSGKSFVKILDDGTLQGRLNAQDFNTCRSNRERGQFRTDPIDGGGSVVGDIVISVASDGKISGSIASGDLSGKSFVKILDDGTLQGRLNAQDFNTCRSNKDNR